jgi:hypothetical protein
MSTIGSHIIEPSEVYLPDENAFYDEMIPTAGSRAEKKLNQVPRLRKSLWRPLPRRKQFQLRRPPRHCCRLARMYRQQPVKSADIIAAHLADTLRQRAGRNSVRDVGDQQAISRRRKTTPDADNGIC